MNAIPATDTSGPPQTDSGPSSNAVLPIPVAQKEEEPLSVSATDLLADYQKDEDGTNRLYQDRRVIVTGVMTGLRIPSPEEEANEADAILSLNTCPAGYICAPEPPLSVVDVATRPGIFAYSKSGSIFGLDLDPTGLTEREVQWAASMKLSGRPITLLCTFNGEHRALIRQDSRYGVPQQYGYSVLLTDCLLQNGSPLEARTQEKAQEQDTKAPTPETQGAHGTTGNPSTVTAPPSFARSDEQIEIDVLDAFKEWTALKGENISVNVSRGDVTLSGTVSRLSVFELAASSASRVPGVTKIRNNLKVVPM